MKNSVYEYLNEMDNGAEGYTVGKVSKKELHGWKKEFDRRNVSSHMPWGKYLAAAAAVAVIVTVSQVGVVRQTVYAGVKTVTYELSAMLGIKADLEPYKTVVGESVTKNGYTVTLNEVVLDEGSLYISDTLTLPEKMESEFIDTFSDLTVFVNGKMVSMAASGSTGKADEYNLVTDTKVEMPEVDTTELLDIEIEYSVNGDKIGEFQFSSSGEELAVDTLTVPLNESFTLPDGSEITLEKYTSNVMGQKIYYTSSVEIPEYQFILKGNDDMGNPVEFFIRFSRKGEGRLEVETIDNGYVSGEAKSLTLTPYAAQKPKKSGRESTDYKQTGEAFTFQIGSEEDVK